DVVSGCRTAVRALATGVDRSGVAGAVLLEAPVRAAAGGFARAAAFGAAVPSLSSSTTARPELTPKGEVAAAAGILGTAELAPADRLG
ncbi:MAG: hypothetical protein ACREMO_08805, partial [Gemmatimonadales bacterium]